MPQPGFYCLLRHFGHLYY